MLQRPNASACQSRLTLDYSVHDLWPLQVASGCICILTVIPEILLAHAKELNNTLRFSAGHQNQPCPPPAMYKH